MLNLGALFWAPSMQPTEGDESLWNLRSPQRAGAGIWSLLLPFPRVFYGSFRRCWLVDLLIFGKAGAAFENKDWGDPPLVTIYYSKPKRFD